MNTLDYKIGIELETLIDSDDFDMQPREYGGYRIEELQDKGIELKTDGSIDRDTSEQYGVEVVTPPLRVKDFYEVVKTVTDCLDKRNARVNQSCGFHVHISHPLFTEKKNVKHIAYTWAAIEDVLYSTQPPSRFGNQYCKRFIQSYIGQDIQNTLPEAKRELISKLSGINRYSGLNLSSLSEHGTIEVRIHSGTIDYKKIVNFVTLLLHFYEYTLNHYDHTQVRRLFAKHIDDDKVNRVLTMLSLPSDVKTFYKRRIKKMNWERMRQTTREALKLIKDQKKYKKKQEEYHEVRQVYEDTRREFDDLSRVRMRRINNL